MREVKKKYNDILNKKNYRVFNEKCTQAAMLMGGIGTGCFSIGSRGQMQDFELMNHPDKGFVFPYTFFAIHGENQEHNFTKVLESRIQPPYAHPQGFLPYTTAGLPRFRHSEMKGLFPFANIRLMDESLPIEVLLEAYNPFIPLNSEDSGIPAVSMKYFIKNTGSESINISVAGSLYNASGYDYVDTYGGYHNKGHAFNRYQETDGISGIYFDNDGIDVKADNYGTLALTGTGGRVSYKHEWSMGQRIDGIHNFWEDFSEDGELSDLNPSMGTAGKLDEFVDIKVGSLCLKKEIKPGACEVFEFCISWCFPYRVKAWPEFSYSCQPKREKIKNYYAVKFENAMDAANYYWKEKERLEKQTKLFTTAVFDSTLPYEVIDAATTNLSILKSCTCFRIENGHFYGFEGTMEKTGSCPGNCTHVWYYAQAVAYLFPELEKNMRENEFLVETDSEGAMQFRSFTELNGEKWNFIPAVDGQMGSIARVYREWKITGDDSFLRRLWPKVVLALEYGIREWDTDGDGVLDGCMHVDYDVEFYGVNPLGNSCYLVALSAAKEMADYLGDQERAVRYRELYEKASALADKMMWNGEYYEQILENVDTYKYQHGKGVLSDQLMGQYYAHLLGLGYIMDEQHIREAVKNIFRYNFRRDFSEHANMQRVYAIYEEEGLLMTTWPKGGRPHYPFFYSEEVWSRSEYPVASMLAYQGETELALSMVKATRDRYDGIKRNPWNEFECGYHYSGIMGSWALLLAYSGFQVNMKKDSITFDPKIRKNDFRCFFSHGKGWGIYTRQMVNGEVEEKLKYLYERK